MINLKANCEEYLNSQDEDSQIKTITKLIQYIKINEKNQKDVFIYLSDRGLSKLLTSMKESSSEIRILSLKFLIELLNNNEVLQNIFCEKFNFNPIGSVICINWFPKVLRENIVFNQKLILEIKNSINVLNSKRTKYWIWPANTKYTDEIFPDPVKYLIGFYFSSSKSNLKKEQESYNSEEIDIRQLNFKLEKVCIDNNQINQISTLSNLNTVKTGMIQEEINNNSKNIAAGSGSESASKIVKKVLENSNIRSYSNNNAFRSTGQQPVTLKKTNYISKKKN